MKMKRKKAWIVSRHATCRSMPACVSTRRARTHTLKMGCAGAAAASAAAWETGTGRRWRQRRRAVAAAAHAPKRRHAADRGAKTAMLRCGAG